MTVGERRAGSMATAPKGDREAQGGGPTTAAQLSWRDRFDRIASRVTSALGSPIAVVMSVVVVIVWLATGPIFGFSDTWQLLINTSTTIVTFWMVFVIQASSNRDNRALHLKLDEVIRAMAKARNEFIATEEATEAEFEVRETELKAIAEGEANGRSGRAGRSAGDGGNQSRDTQRSTRRSTTRTRTRRTPAPSAKRRTGKPSTDGGE